MYIFQVHHYIKPDQVDVYKTAALENVRKTVLEPGVIRFEMFQDSADPTHFSIFEVYQDLAARDAHLETEHLLKFKDVYLATNARRGNGDEFIALYPEEGEWKKTN
jgi:autoinducer 2-degrading protein